MYGIVRIPLFSLRVLQIVHFQLLYAFLVYCIPATRPAYRSLPEKLSLMITPGINFSDTEWHELHKKLKTK
jgi:hypothetical protein